MPEMDWAPTPRMGTTLATSISRRMVLNRRTDFPDLSFYFQPVGGFTSSLISSGCSSNQRLADCSDVAPSPTLRTAHATFPDGMGGNFASARVALKEIALPL